jgi:hypothetical protein
MVSLLDIGGVVDRERAEVLGQIWSRVTARPCDEFFLESITESPCAIDLDNCSDEILMDAALRARQPDVSGGYGLPLSAWADEARALERASRASGQARFEQRLLPQLRPLTPMERAGHRLLGARAREQSLAKSRTREVRRKRLPVGEVPGLEGLQPDLVETAALLLLARTVPEGQFSSTGAGEVFAGVHSGYHLETERIYLGGLSEPLDRLRDDLDSHRSGAFPPGGRFYVYQDGNAECALCRMVFSRVGSERIPSGVQGCRSSRPPMRRV